MRTYSEFLKNNEDDISKDLGYFAENGTKKGAGGLKTNEEVVKSSEKEVPKPAHVKNNNEKDIEKWKEKINQLKSSILCH